MVKIFKTIGLLIVFGCFLFLHSYGQNYTLTGKVIDAANNEALPGAAVVIENTSLGTSTDMDGEFVIRGVKKRNITINVSFISYETLTQKLEFPAGKNSLNTTLKLKPISLDINEVEIVREAEGKVKARIVERRSINIKNVVSFEQIEEYPDVNAAEALQRQPGITLQRDQGEGRYVQLRGTPPELTNFSVNGEQIPSPEGGHRYVGLDIISADQIEYIEVSKVLTPDMDADGIGGNVNIITKKAKDKPETKISVAGGYNQLIDRFNNLQGNFSQSMRYKKFGSSINASYYRNDQVSHNMEFEYHKLPFRDSAYQALGQDNYNLCYDEFQLRHYSITRQRIGLSASFDYEFNKNSKLYISGMYNNFIDDETRRRIIYTMEDPVNYNYYLYGDIDRDLKDRVKNQTLTTINAGGEHDMDFLKLDGEFSYAFASEKQPDRLEILFESAGQTIPLRVNTDNLTLPRIEYPTAKDSANAVDYESYEFDELILGNITTTDENKTYKLNFTIPLKFISESSYFKFGGKIRDKHKIRNNNGQYFSQYYHGEDWARRTYWPASQFDGPELNPVVVSDNFSETNLLNEGYEVSHTPGPQEVIDFYEKYSHQFRLHHTDTKYETFGEDYDANELIQAYYGMLRADYLDWTFVGGLRFSHAKVSYSGNNIVLDSLERYDYVEELNDTRTHQFVLPQFQIKYSPTDRFNIRGAYTYSFTRPKLDDVIPYRTQERKKVKLGNPDLVYPLARNFDVFLEYFGTNKSVFRGGVFYKDIENFIYTYRIKTHEHYNQFTNPEKPRIEKPVNGIEAFVYGAEVLWNYQFQSLPGILGNLGIYGNYTYTFSEAYISERIAANDHRDEVFIVNLTYTDPRLFNEDKKEKLTSMPGQAEHNANFSLFYDDKKWFAKLSANYQSDFLYSLGLEKDFDEYYAASLHLDFNGHYRFNDNLKIFVDAVNITNTPLKYYLGSTDLLLQQEYYSWSLRLGAKLNF